MAFVRNPNEQDDQTETTGQDQGITPTITSGSTVSSGETIAQGQPQKQTGSGFSNLNRYLAANQGGAQNLGNQLAGKIEGATQEAQQLFDPTVNQFNQQVQQGTNIFNPNAVEGDTEDLTGYAGPQNFAGSQQDIALGRNGHR